MHMTEFSAMNRARCESPSGFNHALSSWSLSDWVTATAGELGEAANVAKKLNRVRDGIPGNSETPEQLRQNLADELADTFIYLDLLAQSQGICLEQAVLSKFDKTSRKRGYIGDGLDVSGSPLAGRELAADLADGCSR
jgi:NTP pyrophosphatase (non-canonical NTP hydrolase)